MDPGGRRVRKMWSRSNFDSPKRPSHRGRFLLIRLFVVALFMLLGTRLVYVQGVLRADLKKKADRTFAADRSGTFNRFRILDRNSLPLAETVRVQSCFVDPTLVDNRRHVASALAALLHLDRREVERRIADAKGAFVWIKRDVPEHIVDRIKEKKMRGVAFKSEWRRHYPMGPMASHLLGLVGVDGHGLSGIESQFEKTLDPASPRPAEPFGPHEHRGHVQLTIDARIQEIAEKELEWGIKKSNAANGLVIVQDPRSGEILAMASWPSISLDPDHPPHPKEMRIPALVDVFEPGSTFKIVMAAAALEEGVVRKGEIFDGEKGKYRVADITIHDHEPIKKMTFDEILIFSSNVGSAKIGERLGTERLYQYARHFGFGVFPGSDLPGEAKGVLRRPQDWSAVSKCVVAFGQEVGVTAMQLASAYSAVANGGVLMEPKIIRAVVSPKNKPLWSFSPVPVRQVVSEETSSRLRGILSRVVDEGTGRNARVPWLSNLKIAGKTGTAQKFDVQNRRYSKDLNLVSFCGFFPADRPDYTIVVILDEPRTGSWGGTVAAPLFRRIAEQIASGPAA